VTGVFLLSVYNGSKGLAMMFPRRIGPSGGLSKSVGRKYVFVILVV
jgi:hypothetical protein